MFLLQLMSTQYPQIICSRCWHLARNS